MVAFNPEQMMNSNSIAKAVNFKEKRLMKKQKYIDGGQITAE